MSTITLLLLIAGCQRHGAAFLMPEGPDPGAQLHAAFDQERIALNDAGMEPLPVSLDPRQHLPEISLLPGKNCYFARPGFYHRNEVGLRFSYCSHDISEGLAHLAAQAFALPDAAHVTFKQGAVEGGVTTTAGLRDRIGSVITLYCEINCSSLATFLRPGVMIESSPFLPSGVIAWLPRRFYDRGFDLAITPSALVFIHSIPHSERFFYVQISGLQSSGEVLHFLEASVRGMHERLAGARQNEIYTGGFYPGSVGRSGEERLILSSRDAPATSILQTGTASLKLFLFPESSVVLRRDRPEGFRFMNVPEVTIAGMEPIISDDDLNRSVEGLVLTRKGPDAPFLLGAPCLIEDPCSPEGIHPSLFDSFPREPLPACTPAQIQLTEMNPFGVIRTTGGSLDPGGKFLEFRIHQACLNRTIVIQSGSVRISSPLRLQPGILVLAASTQLFEAPVIERTALRRLSPDSVTVLSEDETQTSVVYENHPEVHFIAGSRTDTPALRRVHSLDYGMGGFSFHEPSCSGLLRTLCPFHAMNPGTVGPGDEARIAPEPLLILSELVPFGSQRFLEFFCVSCSGQKGMLRFRIRRDSDQREDEYALPVPSDSRITIAAQPVCGLNEDARIHFPDLYIPAQAHRLHLSNEDIQISTSTYQLLRNENRSWSRRIDGTFAASSDPFAEGCTVHATPGGGFPYPGGWP